MKVFLLDVFEIFKVDCISPMSLHSKFLSIISFPVVGLVMVQLVRCIADARAGRGGASNELIVERKAKNQTNAAYRSFFLIFLLYPLLSRTTFHMMPTSSQPLADQQSLHMDDYAVDCDSGIHHAMFAVAVIAIAIYPVGIPISFLFLLWRNERKKIVPFDDEAAAVGKGGSSSYDFLKKDYKAEFYYFEVIALSEKLILSGLLVFFDQGSIFQCFAGACVAFSFNIIYVIARPCECPCLYSWLASYKYVALFAVFITSILRMTLLQTGSLPTTF